MRKSTSRSVSISGPSNAPDTLTEVHPVPSETEPIHGGRADAVVQQTAPLGEHGALLFQADYSWQDEAFFSIENVDTESQEAFGLLNLRAGWQSADERWLVEGFLDNALDEEYSIANVDLDPTFGVVAWGEPRWWGVRVRYRR